MTVDLAHPLNLTPWILGGGVGLGAASWIYIQTLKRFPWLNLAVAAGGLLLLAIFPLDLLDGRLADGTAVSAAIRQQAFLLLTVGSGLLLLAFAGGETVRREERKQATLQRAWDRVAERD